MTVIVMLSPASLLYVSTEAMTNIFNIITRLCVHNHTLLLSLN